MSRTTERVSPSTTVAKGRWENNGLLVNEMGALMMEDAEKVQLLNAFFSSLFTARTTVRNPRPCRQESLEKRSLSLVEEDWVQGHLCKLDTNKSMGADRIHPQVLRKIANVIAKPYSIIFERSWSTGDLLPHRGLEQS